MSRKTDLMKQNDFDPKLQGHKYILRYLLQSTYDMHSLWKYENPRSKNEEYICISSNRQV